MSKISYICPNCGINITIEDNQTQVNCPYCGSQSTRKINNDNQDFNDAFNNLHSSINSFTSTIFNNISNGLNNVNVKFESHTTNNSSFLNNKVLVVDKKKVNETIKEMDVFGYKLTNTVYLPDNQFSLTFERNLEKNIEEITTLENEYSLLKKKYKNMIYIPLNLKVYFWIAVYFITISFITLITGLISKSMHVECLVAALITGIIAIVLALCFGPSYLKITKLQKLNKPEIEKNKKRMNEILDEVSRLK